MAHSSDAPLAAALERLYALRFPPAERAERARLWRVLCSDFFDALVPRGGTVLDLGAGYCDFLNAIQAGRRIGIDLNPDTPRAAAPGVEIHSVSLERIGEVIPPASIDFAFASNVLEHLLSPTALLEVLAAVHGVVRPGGRFVVLQPNVRLLGGAFWDFVDHTLPLSDRGMCEAVRAAGFEITECRPRFLPYTTKSRLPTSDFLVRAFLAFPPAQWLLGKQMLIIARRP